MYLKPLAASAYSHPMNSETGGEAVQISAQSIKESSDQNVSWRIKKRVEVGSAIECLQIFSDESQVSLKAGSLVFCRLYLTLLNFKEGIRWNHIMSFRTVCAYLPTKFENSFDVNHELTGTCPGSYKTQQNTTRSSLIQARHDSVEYCLETSCQTCFERITV